MQSSTTDALAVESRTSKGRVLIAQRDIVEGETIEVAPTIEVPAAERAYSLGTKVFEYYFVRPEDYMATSDVAGYLVLGLLTLCSHDNEPNAKVFWDQDECGTWAELRAMRPIEQGEEITLFYTNIGEYGNRNEFI